jgi:hypothetical protein
VAITRDYKGVAICAALALGGALVGFVIPVLLLWLSWMFAGESEALGQGLLLLLAWIICVPVGLNLGGSQAQRFWKQRHPKSISA